jgi:hypothetical protein
MQVVDRYGIVHGVDRIQINGPDGRQKPSSINYGLFAQTAKSVPITNTTQAQSLIYVNFERRVDQDGGVTESLDCSIMQPYQAVHSLNREVPVFNHYRHCIDQRHHHPLRP